jgi:catechol-2,3-dioxygenase
MTANQSPVTGFSHVQLRVRDLATSERWYATVLGMQRLVASEADGYVALRHPSSGHVVVLTVTTAEGSDLSSDRLDHLAFAVPDGATLEVWADELIGRGIRHDGVVDELGKPSLSLVDPDGIHVELVAPPGSFG